MDDERFLGWVLLIVLILSGVGIVIEYVENKLRDLIDAHPLRWVAGCAVAIVAAFLIGVWL